MNSSGIGALLDQISLGEPEVSIQPSTYFEDDIHLGASVAKKIKSKILNRKCFYLKFLLDNNEIILSLTITSGLINLHQG